MNFFGSSGHINLVDAKMRGPHQQMSVKVKPLHNSDEEIDISEGNSLGISKHGSLSRQRKSNQQRLRNRKNNKEFRSVWYDEETEYEGAPTTEATVPGKGSMRKSSSLGNLLDINNRDRCRPLLTKNMISSPLCPRKIKGNWTDKKEVYALHTPQEEIEAHYEDSVTISRMETDRAPIPEHTDNIESRIAELNILDRDRVLYIPRKALSFENLFKFNTLDARRKRKSSLDAAMTRTLPRKMDDVMELQSFNLQIPQIAQLDKKAPIEQMASVTTEISNTDNKRDVKKGPSLENLSKISTLDNRNNRRNILKLDISAPTLPRKIEENGDVIPLDALCTEGVTNLLRAKSKSTTELLKSFNHNEKFEHTNDPKFPLTESDEIDNEVQIRRNRNISQYRSSKTTDFDFGRIHVKDKDFEIKTCSKMLIPHESSPIKLRKNESIKYQNGHFYKTDENTKKILIPNVTLKSARLLNKRDVELKDSNNLTYIIFFDSSKDAKSFVENEKVSRYIDNDNKSTITKTLLRLLGKRSSREVLEKKGIYQNEPIFGNTLKDIYRIEKGVPKFILKTIELIERPENITSLGLYRTSGNLATIQKIRFEVDKGRLDILNEFCKDVDVLTGSLKLFFRELKEPLIPCGVCDSLLEITKTDNIYSKKDRDKIRSILNKLPEANSETLSVLITHLAKVVKYKESNKMDTYNLSVCWGPTIIFITDSTENAQGKDIVTQSTDATRLFDALLTFYIDNPDELYFGRRRQDQLEGKHVIQRHDSKDSIQSSDSNNSKTLKKIVDGSNASLNVDEVLKKSIEIIELNINSEGLYKKSGSTEKINKMIKKMTKKKINELEKYKYDVHELTDTLKKYVRDLPEPLATREVVEQVIKFCDNTPCLEQNNRQKIISVVEDLPKKDTLIYLLKHIIRVLEHESHHNVSKSDMISIWTNVLNYQKRITDSTNNFSNFLRILLDVFDETKPDAPSPKGIANGLLNDLKNYQKDKDRCSKYDNVPEAEVGVLREMTIPEEKTEGTAEFTKL